MPKRTSALIFIAMTAALGGAARAPADVVATKNGARLVGKVTKIDGGIVYLTTDYAGALQVKQKEVTSIATDGPVAVRLADGVRLNGEVTLAPDGTMQIVGPAGVSPASVEQIVETWPVSDLDPAVVLLQRHWKFEASLDINGTSGNSNQLGTALGFRAIGSTPTEVLQYYMAYNRQVTEGVKSADQFKMGVDYAEHFTNRWSRFVRDEAGYDRVMDEKRYDTAAIGYGYDLIKNKADTLTARAGLAYRYDDYGNPLTPTVSSAAADFELAHDLKLHDWELKNLLTVVPAFQDTKDVIVTQDSFFQIPIADPHWKLRMGVANDYNSEPGPGIRRLDTTYYTRLILDWQ